MIGSRGRGPARSDWPGSPAGFRGRPCLACFRARRDRVFSPGRSSCLMAGDRRHHRSAGGLERAGRSRGEGEAGCRRGILNAGRKTRDDTFRNRKFVDSSTGERWIRTIGSAISHRRQRDRGLTPPDLGGEWRLLVLRAGRSNSCPWCEPDNRGLR